MPSLIPGYEYDIFISYRQKDNKGDRWVSEFVDALKTELESTFKEEISVYFDINSHDGLLETHDVDASLKDKLKCLVFIPIISRTYCDPKSFAWEHEFKAFVDLASKDQFGLKVKLPNGNIASRVLPVRIHDLETEDVKLFEGVIGSVMRTLDFVFITASGVNRPLKVKEDHPNDNLNKTYYQDQINKVSLAIKEIIIGLGQHEQKSEVVQKEIPKTVPIQRKSYRTKIIAGSILVFTLIVLGFLFVPKLFKPSEQLEKSIAVLPFKLLSDEPDKQYLADGMMDAITLHLSKIKDLRVMPRTSVEQYRGTIKTSRQIGKELEVDYLLEGSFQKFGNDAKLIVQLIKAGEESNAWGNEYNSKWSEVFSLQSEVAQSIANELQAVITPLEKQLIEKVPTANLTALDFYQRGREEIVNYWLNNNNQASLKKAEDLYQKAIEYDSTYAQAYSGLAMLELMKYNAWRLNTVGTDYFTSSYLDSSQILANLALTYDAKLAEAYYVKGLYFWNTGNEENVLDNIDKASEYNPNDWMVYEFKGFNYYIYSKQDQNYVKAIENLKKAISLNHGRELPELITSLGLVYSLMAGFPEEGEKCFVQALMLNGDSVEYLNTMGQVELNYDDFDKSIEYYTRAIKIDSTKGSFCFLGGAYAYSGKYKESLKYINKSAEQLKAHQMTSEGQSHRIGYTYWKNGYLMEADYWFNEQKRYCEESINNKRFSGQISLTSYYDLACVYAFRGEKQKAYENLKVLRQLTVFPKWWLNLIKRDPLLENLRGEPEFQRIVDDIETKYQAEHNSVKKWLEEQGML
jgi:TolB-like protein/Tfp pilus assembly protein PilF